MCKGVNFTILRELTGGIYFGERREDEGDGTALDTEPYSREEITRITRLAGYLALAEDPPLPVWSLDKANVLATSRLWRKVVTEVIGNEFPTLRLGHHLIDSAAMLMVKNPRALNGIVVTSNLFGDIISDEASVIPGSLGLLPSASLGGIPEPGKRVNGIYEPIHGGCFQGSSTSCEFEIANTAARFCARYLWKGYRKSGRVDSVHFDDAQVLSAAARAGSRRGPRREDCN